MDNLDYGIIGNCTSAALIDKTGTIDWCCLPAFDSPSVFAGLLDRGKGGHFSIIPENTTAVHQCYTDKTNILVTTFSAQDHAFEIIDFMPRYKTRESFYYCPPDIIRYFRVLRGRPQIRIDYQPRPGYARDPVRMEVAADYIKHMTAKGVYESIYLYSNLPFDKIVHSTSIVLDGDGFLLLSYNQKLAQPTLDRIRLEYERTQAYWIEWVAKATVSTCYAKQVERSSLVLKLLAYQKTGAILAAITTSLPETLGQIRNWDYRFCWIRDASMTIRVLCKLGHHNVAKRFLQFILDVVPYKDEKIQILYPITHRGRLVETELPWLNGYENSRPVRIGNAAAKQKQNDIYGILLDAIYQSLVVFHETMNNKEDVWTVVRTLARHVLNNWKKLDSSIWEFRTEQRHFTFSKILCWVAMDRAARIASFFGKQNEAVNYMKLRDKIKSDILRKGCDPKTGALAQYYGSTAMDAANLLAVDYGFLSPSDPIYISTVSQTVQTLCSEGLMYRYKTPDDFGVPHSSFTTCTFWAIKGLYLTGQKERAIEMFEQLLGCSNHVGLFSEDIDFTTKRLLGNFPQGYSHISLIDTALTLSESPEWFSKTEPLLP